MARLPQLRARGSLAAGLALLIFGGGLSVLLAAPQQGRPGGVIGSTQKAPGPRTPRKFVPRYAPNVVVVTYRGAADSVAKARVERTYGLVRDAKVPSRYFTRYFIGPAARRAGETVESMCERLARDPGVRTADADIDAPEAWAIVPDGNNAIVAVLDDGVLTTHADLQANIFVNQAETPNNGVDDDNNGYVDDVSGWDTADNDNNPNPDSTSDTHGTHVAGTVAAVTNNGVGVAGVGKRVKILPVRMYEGQATWMTSLANGIDYSRITGAKVISVSYNLDGFTTFLTDAIVRAQNADVLFVGSAGNNGQNIDELRGRMKQAANNIVFVAATDRNDQMASFSNFGQTVDIAAPGVAILSTVASGGYDLSDGTSMATPHVSGAAGVIRAMYPSLTYAQVAARLTGGAEMKAALDGRIAGGRLNLANALDNDTVAPSNPSVPTLLARSSGRLRLRFNGSGDDGTTGQASRYEVRVSSAPITSANFTSARLGVIVPGTVASGAAVNAEVPGLDPGATVYFAVRAFDNVGNASAIAAAGPATTKAATWKDDMEGTAAWTGQSGKTWTLTSGNAFSGTKAWEDSPGGNYANSEDSSLTQNGTVATNGPAAVRFKAKYDLESGFDFLAIEFSRDNGSTWARAGAMTGSSGGWTTVSALIPGSGSQTLKLRFRLTSDTSVVRDGVVIDDVSLVALTGVLTDNLENGTTNWTPNGPWTLSTERALSPTRAWNDSPGGQYASGVSALLEYKNSFNVANLAEPTLGFGYWSDLESGYDFLDVYALLNGSTTPKLVGFVTGNSGGWASLGVALPAGTTSFRPLFNLSTDDSVTRDGVCMDDLVVYGEPWEFVATVGGTLSLDEFSGAPRPVTVEIRNVTNQAVLETHNVTPQLVGGAYKWSISTFRSGNHTVAVKGANWLRRRQNVVLAAGDNLLDVTLVNGDADGDNRITTTDYVSVNNRFGAQTGNANYAAACDLNGDGKIDALDLAIVVRNLRKRGDS